MKQQREAQAMLGCVRENKAIKHEEQCLIHTQRENDPYRKVFTSVGTEEPHGHVMQMGSGIMGEGAKDSHENDNNHGSLRLNRPVPSIMLPHTSFHLKQWS